MLLTFVLQTRLIQVRVQNRCLYSISCIHKFIKRLYYPISHKCLDEFLEKLCYLGLEIAVRWIRKSCSDFGQNVVPQDRVIVLIEYKKGLMEKCSKISHLSKSDNHTQEIGDCVIRQFPLSSWRQQLTGATVKLHSRSTLRDQKRSRRQHSNYQQCCQLFWKWELQGPKIKTGLFKM